MKYYDDKNLDNEILLGRYVADLRRFLADGTGTRAQTLENSAGQLEKVLQYFPLEHQLVYRLLIKEGREQASCVLRRNGHLKELSDEAKKLEASKAERLASIESLLEQVSQINPGIVNSEK